MSFSRRKVLRALAKRGFSVKREGASHTIVQHPDGKQLPVPRHREIQRGTAKAIADQAGIDWPDFEREAS